MTSRGTSNTTIVYNRVTHLYDAYRAGALIGSAPNQGAADKLLKGKVQS